MILDILSLNGSESSESDVKGEFSYLDARVLKLFQKLLREMKTCGRSRCRTRVFGIDGLISFGIVELFVDIGRKGNLTCFVQDFFPNAVEFKSDYAVAVLKDLFALGFEFVLDERKPSAFVNLLPGLARVSQWLSSILLRRRSSTGLFVSLLTPKSLAGMTLVLLMTRTSPLRRKSGRS